MASTRPWNLGNILSQAQKKSKDLGDDLLTTWYVQYRTMLPGCRTTQTSPACYTTTPLLVRYLVSVTASHNHNHHPRKLTNFKDCNHNFQTHIPLNFHLYSTKHRTQPPPPHPSITFIASHHITVTSTNPHIQSSNRHFIFVPPGPISLVVVHPPPCSAQQHLLSSQSRRKDNTTTPPAVRQRRNTAANKKQTLQPEKDARWRAKKVYKTREAGPAAAPSSARVFRRSRYERAFPYVCCPNWPCPEE